MRPALEARPSPTDWAIRSSPNSWHPGRHRALQPEVGRCRSIMLLDCQRNRRTRSASLQRCRETTATRGQTLDHGTTRYQAPRWITFRAANGSLSGRRAHVFGTTVSDRDETSVDDGVCSTPHVVDRLPRWTLQSGHLSTVQSRPFRQSGPRRE
jgi:hypothetical protein